MIELVSAIVLFIFMALAMALGQLFGRRGVQGSCGGLNRIPGLRDSCGACTNKRCPRKQQRDSVRKTNE